MARVQQNSKGKGSLKNIQLLINNHTIIINTILKQKYKELDREDIIWVSPLESDNYAEYSDNDFLIKLGLDRSLIEIGKFWPHKGPRWDALAKTTSGRIILVEAKANKPELKSNMRATSKSEKLITHSFEETKSFFNVKTNNDWSKKYYQYTNRLAHLYYLREVRKVSAYLVNIYFCGDTSVNGPKNEMGWQISLNKMRNYLGIDQHTLAYYISDIFLYIDFVGQEKVIQLRESL